MRDHRRLVRSLRSGRTQRLVIAMARWIKRGPWLERYRRSQNEALQDYCTRELGRWHKRLVRKGRHLKTLGASPRHRLRIKAKRFRYILEALRETDALQKPAEWRRLHRPAKQLQRTLGDLRDLARVAELAAGSPPGYRRRTEELLDAAVSAYRDLKDAIL